MNFTYEDVAKMIDHSLLNPTLTWLDLEKGCLIAREYQVASVCIAPFALKHCVEILAGSTVKPSTTIGFPHGCHKSEIKFTEAMAAIDDGAMELDMVVNISKVLSGDWEYVRHDIHNVVHHSQQRGAKVKVIFENCYLTDEQKVRLCEICGEIGVDWVKTSTGYGTGGATDADLILMRKHSPGNVQVKAAGGVRTLDRLLEVRALGVTRCGATQTVAMLEDAKQRLGMVAGHNAPAEAAPGMY
ncbi:MAG: deoxyribose-phosphate aldolase [Bryobacterales bacterium]|nr:deoxyribose-phosphate aldolase [Bryobacterales bacterium]